MPTATSTRPRAPPTWASATPRDRSARPRRPTWSTPRPREREIFVGAAASRVLVEDGRAAGVEASWSDPAAPQANGAGAATLTVRAPVVVVAAGAIQSPALLLRSRIGGPAVGDYLRLHPTVAVTAYYDEPQNWMWGPPQAALSHQYADTGDGYGFLIECAQATTGLFAGAIPWRSGADHKRRMREWAHAAPFVGVTRERGHGRVVIDAAGNPLVHYPIADERDQRTLKLAVEQLVRVHEAAGAREIVGSGMRAPDWTRGDDLEAFVDALNGLAIVPREYVTFSAHQMGSCRMGRDPQTSVANPWGELHDTPGRLGRRRQRLPERLGHQPDGDDHGARPAHRARDRLRVGSPGERRRGRQAHRRGHRPDRRRRPGGRARARGAPGGRADRRHGAPAVRPRRARVAAHRVSPRRHPRARLDRGAGRGRRRRRPPRVHHLRRPRRGPPRQPRGLAQRVRGDRGGGGEAARLHLLGRRLRLRRRRSRLAHRGDAGRRARRASTTPPTRASSSVCSPTRWRALRPAPTCCGRRSSPAPMRRP